MKKLSTLIKLLAPVIAMLTTPVAQATMTLDNEQSTISFVSIKKGTTAEVHTFSNLSGTLSDEGNLSIDIELDSVQTNVDIRNTRMREMLFETMQFPSAELTALVSTPIPDGSMTPINVEALLSLHGATANINVHALATRVDGQLLVTNTQPVIVNAGDFGLVPGIEALRQVAKLSSIPIAVPVSFTLVFR